MRKKSRGRSFFRPAPGRPSPPTFGLPADRPRRLPLLATLDRAAPKAPKSSERSRALRRNPREHSELSTAFRGTPGEHSELSKTLRRTPGSVPSFRKPSEESPESVPSFRQRSEESRGAFRKPSPEIGPFFSTSERPKGQRAPLSPSSESFLGNSGHFFSHSGAPIASALPSRAFGKGPRRKAHDSGAFEGNEGARAFEGRANEDHENVRPVSRGPFAQGKRS